MWLIISYLCQFTFNIHDNISKNQKVFFIEKKFDPQDQNESIATKYINHFAIDENDQFEIAAFQNLKKGRDVYFDEDKALQAVKNLSRKQMEGLYYFHLIQFLIYLVLRSVTGKNDYSSHDVLENIPKRSLKM